MDVRLAAMDDLPGLKAMYRRLVRHMEQNGLQIWDDSYPCEFFAEDIACKRLYLLAEKDEIVAAFALCGTNEGESRVIWENNRAKAVYMDRLGVNTAYLRKGMGSLALRAAMALAKGQGAAYLRLFVVDCNQSAINLYVKNGFQQAGGVFDEIIDESLTLHEFGFEIRLS